MDSINERAALTSSGEAPGSLNKLVLNVLCVTGSKSMHRLDIGRLSIEQINLAAAAASPYRGYSSWRPTRKHTQCVGF